MNYIDISIELELQSRLLENNISPEEKAKAETEILAMQRMMGENMKDMMNNLMLSFIQASHYKEAGDFSMSMNLNIDEVNIESGIDFSDYIATSQMFDQQVQGEIEAFLKGIVDGESVDIQMETLIDFVSTEGNMYLLMENLKLIDGSSEKEFETLMKPFIEKMQELATSETYLAFEDADTQVLIDIFSNFSQENINAQIDTMLAKPLLEAYAKDGDTYILRPSQYFCDMGKTVSQVFDPFYDDETCSESQYRDMLSEMQEAGVSLSLTLEDENTLSLKIDNSTVL